MSEKAEDLVQRALRGDQDAVAALYRLYESEMIAVVHQKMGHKLRSLMESVDVVQSVWKDVLGDINDFESRGPGSFSRWLHTCLIHKIRAKGRHHAAGKRDPDRVQRLRGAESDSTGIPAPAAPDPTPSHVAISREEFAKLMEILDRFPDSQRRVMVLRMRDGLEYSEIGRIIGRSAEATKKLFGRGLKKFIDLLAEEEQGKGSGR